MSTRKIEMFDKQREKSRAMSTRKIGIFEKQREKSGRNLEL